MVLTDAVPEEIDLDGFWRGDGAALEAVYRRHARLLLGVAGTVVGPVEAEAVVHEVFVELIRREELRRRFVGGAFQPWLSAIARLKALEHLRRLGRPTAGGETEEGQEGRQGIDPSPEPQLEARNLLSRFLASSVPAAQMAFFRGRFLDGRTQVDLALELKMPRSTLEGWEHRLADKLRSFILEASS